jgi:hypothetical protein
MPSRASDAEALQNIITQLTRLDRVSRQRVLRAVGAYFGDGPGFDPKPNAPIDRDTLFLMQDPTDTPTLRHRSAPYSFEDASQVSPKDFLAAKRPASDVERVTCLAFFLTHMAKQKLFKTLDISRLNTEAAQPKLSNAAYAISNAIRAGFLALAQKGQRQLTAAGERYVQELPDRQKAREAAQAVLPRRRSNGAKRSRKP